jgi:valyl-tRNA synthetase
MGAEEMAQLPLPERWVVSRLHTLTANVTDQLENYDFGPVRACVQ